MSSKKLNDLLPENAMKTCSCRYCYLPIAEVFIDLIVRHGPPRPPRLYRTLRLSRHLKVLVFFMLLPRRQANYDLILVVDRIKKMLRDEPVQINQCTRAGGDNFRRCNLIPQSPRLSDRDSVFTSKLWSPWYHFRARLQLHAFELMARVFYEEDIGPRSRFN